MVREWQAPRRSAAEVLIRGIGRATRYDVNSAVGKYPNDYNGSIEPAVAILSFVHSPWPINIKRIRWTP